MHIKLGWNNNTAQTFKNYKKVSKQSPSSFKRIPILKSQTGVSFGMPLKDCYSVP